MYNVEIATVVGFETPNKVSLKNVKFNQILHFLKLDEFRGFALPTENAVINEVSHYGESIIESVYYWGNIKIKITNV